MRRSPGNTDQAVESYLKGELVSSGANCDHHHHEEGHSCGSHEEGHSCGDSCGGGCGGCGGSQPQLTGRNVGKPAAHITEEPSMTEHSLIPLTIVANRWNSSAAQVR